MTLRRSNQLAIPENEIVISAVRAQGPGGQNVNKASTAVHLRFNIRASSLPDLYKERLLHLEDHRISKAGVVVIKARQYRSLAQNREAALRRLHELLQRVTVSQRKRTATRPTRSSQNRRIERKKRRSRIKALRSKVNRS